MSYEMPGTDAPEELPCRYGASKLLCRGPRRTLSKPYIAFLGGSETYGKYVQWPFTVLLEAELGRRCVNLGCVNAGIDAFAQDREILRIAGNADLAVIQVLGAQNLSNRLYRVHPRRNDRFLQASPRLSALYREVDFTEFHFNKHLLGTLHALSPERFAPVRDELQRAWLGRMRILLRALKRRPVLLWLRYQDGPDGDAVTSLGAEPMLIDRALLDMLAPEIEDVVEVDVATAAETGELGEMVFGPLQAPAAQHMIGPRGHRDIAGRSLTALGALG